MTRLLPLAVLVLTPGVIALVASVNGRRQLTYDGHPLYLYAGGQKPGDTPGRGLNQFGAAWHLVSPSDETIDED